MIIVSLVCSYILATHVFCDVFLLYALSISLRLCSCYCSMPPARTTRGRGRGRPSHQASSVRRTRSRTRAVPPDMDADCAAPSGTVPARSPPFVDPAGYQPVSFGRPPAQCAEVQDFDTAPGLRAVIDDSALPRSAWELDMERRVISSERMLGEIRTLVSNLRPTAPTAALGSAAQSVSADLPTGEGRHAVPLVPAAAGSAFPDAPWPSVDTFFPGTAIPPLSEDTQTLLSSCTSTALPLDAQIPDVLRAKIMAGDYIDLSLLLKPSLIQPQEFALSIDRGATNPTVCVSPAKPKDAVMSVDQWGRAFQLYMSVYLLQPANLPSAVKMLKYMEVVRGLADAGGDWRSYDAAFRTLRGRCGWAWDSISWELWLKASQSQAGRRLAGPPFHGQGRARPPASSPCYAFNRGELCRSDTCRYTHKCRFCGGTHPVVRCFKANAHGKSPRPAFPPSSGPSGGASTASGLPAWHRR